MGQNRCIDDDQVRNKRTPSFPSHESMSRGTLKIKGGGNLSVHFCADGDTIETFFAQSFLAISAVSTEQSQICVKNFAPADLLVTTPTPSIEIVAQENLMQKHKERVEKLPQPDRLMKNLY